MKWIRLKEQTIHTMRKWCNPKNWDKNNHSHTSSDSDCYRLALWAQPFWSGILIKAMTHIVKEWSGKYVITLKEETHYGTLKHNIGLWWHYTGKEAKKEFILETNLTAWRFLNTQKTVHLWPQPHNNDGGLNEEFTRKKHSISGTRLITLFPWYQSGSHFQKHSW
jgi:hypothetical protein